MSNFPPFTQSPLRFDDKNVEELITPHILRAPPRMVSVPRTERINPADVVNEFFEDGDAAGEYLSFIPMGTNPAAQMGFGHSGITSNVRNLTGQRASRYVNVRPEPGVAPPSGQLMVVEHQLENDLLPPSHQRRPDTSIPAIEQHWEDYSISIPDRANNVNKLMMAVQPSAVYSLPLIPEGQHIGIRRVVYKPETGIRPNPIIDIKNPDGTPQQTTHYINNKNLQVYLKSGFNAYIKINDDYIPIKLKNPTQFALQASDYLPLDIPLPDGSNTRLKDYTWSFVQPYDSPIEFVVEIQPDLKFKHENMVAIQTIQGAYQKFEHRTPEYRIAEKTLPPLTAPNTYTQFNHNPEMGLPFEPQQTYDLPLYGLEIMPNQAGVSAARVEMTRKPRQLLQPHVLTDFPIH